MLVNFRVTLGTDKAPSISPMAANTLVNGRMTNSSTNLKPLWSCRWH